MGCSFSSLENDAYIAIKYSAFYKVLAMGNCCDGKLNMHLSEKH